MTPATKTATINRRAMLGSTAALAGAAITGTAKADTPASDAFTFEFIRTEEEWRNMLTPEQFFLLRQGGTEPPQSHPYWEETAAGTYHCAGCDLPLYDGYWKEVLEIGWVFFRHSEPMSVLTAIDRLTYGEVSSSGENLSTMAANAEATPDLTEEEIRALDQLAGVEAICRRCGSHLGHIVSIKNQVLHCINGGSLNFKPA